MIELLIKYIEDKGYTVDVLPGRLFISRIVEDQIFGVWWAISKPDLRLGLEECLYWDATNHMNIVTQAIAKQLSCPIGGSK